MFPVWLPSVLLLLDRETGRVKEKVSGCDSVGVLQETGQHRHNCEEERDRQRTTGGCEEKQDDRMGLQSAIQLLL